MLFLGSSSVRPEEGDKETAPGEESRLKSGSGLGRSGLLSTSIKIIALLFGVAVTAIIFTQFSTLKAGEQFMLSQRNFNTSIDAIKPCFLPLGCRGVCFTENSCLDSVNIY